MALINKPEQIFGIIHLSDIHFSTDTHLKTDLFFNAIRDEFMHCNKIFLVVSGDVANTGQPCEYEKALDFLTDVVDKLNQRYPNSEVRYIIVPGNHDCNFTLDSQLRQNVINNLDNYDMLGNDNSVLETCLSVQSNFWDFYSLVCDHLPENKLYYKIKDTIGNKSICFHCFNTSWMSQIKEKPGTLFFPIKKTPELKEASDCDINISIYHHPISWFNPDTIENNKKEFQRAIDSLSSIQLIGHEHKNERRRTEDLDNPSSKTLCMSSEVFYTSEHPDESGFQLFVFNMDTNTFLLNRFKLKGDLYQRDPQKEFPFEGKSQRQLELQSDFMIELDRISVPLTFDEGTVSLSDLYVYPDLEELDLDTNKTIDYISAESLLDSNEEATFLLEGESQVGKSALLKMLFLRFYNKGLFPLLLNGKDVNNDNIERILHLSFIKQYNSIDGAEDRFRQLPKEKKVLLLDDMHTCTPKRSGRQKLLQTISDLFGFRFITIDMAFSVFPQCQTSFKKLKTYSIMPLGCSKRNALVDNYLKCKHSTAFSDEERFEKSKEMFDKLCTILGDRFIPPYPIFILSILQTLEYTPLNTSETSYGYCYQTLIHLALNQVGVTNDNIDTYINFITDMAFELFNKKTDSFSDIDLQMFYNNYTNTYCAPNHESMVSNLLKSKILKKDFDSMKFGYIYIYYFLAAKKIADVMDTQKGKIIVNDLFDNLHVEQNANILVFITHHTKNISFIEDATFNAMIPFDGSRVDGSACAVRPSQNRTCGFPAYGSSSRHRFPVPDIHGYMWFSDVKVPYPVKFVP